MSAEGQAASAIAAIVAVGVLLALMGVGTAAGTFSDSGTTSDSEADETTKVEDRLRDTSLFLGTTGPDQIECEAGGPERSGTRYACDAVTDGQTTRDDFLLFDGEVGRITKGGQLSSPPASADEAAERVTEAITERSGESFSSYCIEDAADAYGGSASDQYMCSVVSNPSASQLVIKWHPNGTVASETLEETSDQTGNTEPCANGPQVPDSSGGYLPPCD